MKKSSFILILLAVVMCFSACGGASPSSFTVEYVKGDGVVTTVSDVASGTKLSQPSNPTRFAYTFSGWYRDSGCTVAWDFESDTVNSNIKLYAKWTETEIASNTFSVWFNSNGGEAVQRMINVENNAKIAEPKACKVGCVLLGWYKDAELKSAWNFESDTVTANTTLYAAWADVKGVMFRSMGGSAVKSVSAKAGSKITPPANPTNADERFVFDGWYKEESCTNIFNFAQDTVAANTTLYAKWKQIKFNVNFDSKGGNEIDPIINLEANSTIEEPSLEERWGYTFEGWFKDEAFTERWSFEDNKVNEDITLYAFWAAIPNPGSRPISTRAEFESIRDNLEGDYHLTNDIDFAGEVFRPFNDGAGGGNYTEAGSDESRRRFRGTFDGRGYALRNITAQREEMDSQGHDWGNSIFGQIGVNGVVKNLAVIGFTATGTGQTSVLALHNFGRIENIYLEDVNVSTKNLQYSGGEWQASAAIIAFLRPGASVENVVVASFVGIQESDYNSQTVYGAMVGEQSGNNAANSENVKNIFVVNDTLIEKDVFHFYTAKDYINSAIFAMSEINSIDFSALPSEYWTITAGELPKLRK